MFGLGITAALGLVSIVAIMQWKRSQGQGIVLPGPSKSAPGSIWQPDYGQAPTVLAAPHPTRPDTAAYLVPQGRVVRGFDMVRNPPHWGFDVSAPIGTPVHAAKGGRVVYAGRFPGYGISVGISHGPRLSTWYAHLNQAVVRVGQTVRGGDAIGEVGRTTEGDEAITTAWGRLMGSHLHFEVHPAEEPRAAAQQFRRTDPSRWIIQQNIAPAGRRS